MSLVQWLGVMVPAFVAGVGFLVYRANKGNAFIDQLQEQEQETRRRLEKVETETIPGMQAVQTEQGRVINRQADYIGELRKHIAEGKPPPPPPYPEGLRV